jgi:hypothetical protein
MIFKDIANFSKTSDYLPILNGTLITDLFVILLLNTYVIKSKVLREWYGKYNLSAVIADVLIIFIGILIARYFYYYIFNEFSIVKFALLCVVIQVIHDVLFYVFFKTIPRGYNMMLDTFKDYANEVSYKAIFADSGMMIMASVLSSFLAGQSLNTNLITLILSVYVLPYFIYH